jgi:DNA polymerase-2
VADTRAVTVRGFILQPTYRYRRGRPVVHLFGVLEDGGGFLVRDGSLIPHFYIEEPDAPRALELGASRQQPTDKVTLGHGRPVVRVDLDKPSDTPDLRDRLQEHGIRCWEADVRFAMRFLIDHGIRGVTEIRGVPKTWDEAPGVRLTVFDDPELAPVDPEDDWTPELRVLSLDIETDPRARRLLSVALHGCGASEVLLLTSKGQEAPEGSIPFPTERQLLNGFADRVRELDPDVLTGWNVVDFDLTVFARRAEELEVSFGLGRVPGKLKVRRSRFRGGRSSASVPGRLVLDGIELMRGSFVSMDDWSLDAVSREVLGEGKTFGGGGEGNRGGDGAGQRDKVAEIQRTFREDRTAFVEYNLTDARLVTDLLDKLHLVELAVERSRLTGLPPDRTSGSIAAFDFLYLSELGRRGVVAPTVGSGPEIDQPTHGGYVLEPTPGLYENVLVFDFQSLYPSLIRTFQIDPLGHLPDWGDDDGPANEWGDGTPIMAPNGAAFRRERGILTQMLDELFPRRAEAKRRGDDIAAYAIKILMNSFYGVLATPACRFHDPRIANAITSFGRELLLWCRGKIEKEYDRKVLYGDTDSLFVESGAADPTSARALGDELLQSLNHDLTEHIRSTWQAESRLVLEFDRLYLKLLLPEVRGGGHGARKRYAGLIEREGPEGTHQETVFTGLEVVRRDWTNLARRVQRELYERLFTDRPVDEYLRREVRELRAGNLDRLLVYRKGLRKELAAYTSTTPPHVAAARKMSDPPGRVVEYVWTRNGPEPATERRSDFDYEHYVEKQIQPVAEPVLGQLGLEFAKVIGDDRQMDLF